MTEHETDGTELDQHECDYCGPTEAEIVDYYGNDVPACQNCGTLL